MEAPINNTLVYGVVANNLIFIPEEQAKAWARRWYAIQNAKSWGEFIAMTSQEDFDELILEILETLGHEALFPQYQMGEDLSLYITDLVLPQADDPFTTDILPGFDEGEYMPHPAQEIIAWLPDELQENIGELQLDEAAGFIYYIQPENTELVLTSLQAAGFNTRHDEALVRLASGYPAG